MRDPKRIPKMLDALKALWESSPDLRLGQLIINLATSRELGPHLDSFNIEDDEMLKRIELWHRKNMLKIYGEK